MVNYAYKGCYGDLKAFIEILEQAEKPSYSGCTKFNKLGFLMKLFNVNGRFGWSGNSFIVLLSVLADGLPENNEISTSMFEVIYRKVVPAKVL